jgi:DNA-binding GntR family transcriptional regulator
VETIVWSSDASSSTSSSAAKITRTRWAGTWGADGSVEDDADCMGASSADGAGSRATSADAVADVLQERILRGDLAPGVHLSEVDLARELAVGRHTLRAALARLGREGLVVHFANRGAFVATPSLAAGDDLFAYRTLLEQGGLALALERAADLGGLRAALGVLSALPEDEPWGNVARAHYGIHGAIVDAAGSDRLSAAYAALRAELLFFVTCIRPNYSVRGLTEDHTRLVEAIERRDPAEAARALAADSPGGHASLRAASPR